MTFRIGNIQVSSSALFAPMAGLSDLPTRKLVRQHGAGLTYSEMLTSDLTLWESEKSQGRLPLKDDPFPRPVQIAGNDPEKMAQAAKALQDMGAGLIDINMGCPAKKVCKKAAGSALLAEPQLIQNILQKTVAAVDIPVTLKTRTGTDADNKNFLEIAKIAEDSGINAICFHGRTRADKFQGHAEYDSVALAAEHVDIPVVANGDIQSAYQAHQLLNNSCISAVMIGRGALGNPWIFEQITTLQAGKALKTPNWQTFCDCILEHFESIHLHYTHQHETPYLALGFARKHMDWYFRRLDAHRNLSKAFNALQTKQQQNNFLDNFFQHKHPNFGDAYGNIHE